MATRALVLAGGGIAGIAWESGVLEGLHEAGVDTSRWDLVVGTSAGSYVGARLLGDESPEPLYRVQTRSPSSEEDAALKRLFGGSFWLAGDGLGQLGPREPKARDVRQGQPDPPA